MSKTVSAVFKAADCLLEGFLIVLADAHDLADSSHLCSELIFHTLEFFKCPACELDNHIVAVWDILIKSSVFSARDVTQGKACRQHG